MVHGTYLMLKGMTYSYFAARSTAVIDEDDFNLRKLKDLRIYDSQEPAARGDEYIELK